MEMPPMKIVIWINDKVPLLSLHKLNWTSEKSNFEMHQMSSNCQVQFITLQKFVTENCENWLP